MLALVTVAAGPPRRAALLGRAEPRSGVMAGMDDQPGERSLAADLPVFFSCEWVGMNVWRNLESHLTGDHAFGGFISYGSERWVTGRGGGVDGVA